MRHWQAVHDVKAVVWDIRHTLLTDGRESLFSCIKAYDDRRAANTEPITPASSTPGSDTFSQVQLDVEDVVIVIKVDALHWPIDAMKHIMSTRSDPMACLVKENLNYLFEEKSVWSSRFKAIVFVVCGNAPNTLKNALKRIAEDFYDWSATFAVSGL